MKCHYEVLGVEQDADDATLKRAYRKAALKWHPDKNMERLEEATAAFQLVQAAYAVLSDPHERQWYDDHRESILRGGSGLDDEAADGVDLMGYFSSSCFHGYGDDDSGFYTVYREAFELIYEAELYLTDDEPEPPSFGTSTSGWADEVAHFYRYWRQFTTTNTFATKDKWDTREAPNRQVKRLMEKENKKLRDAARKEYTQTVRQLVSHVQKLDRKRRMRHQAAVAAEREQQQRERAEHDEAKRRERASELDAILEAERAQLDWAAMEREFEALEQQLDADFGGSASDTDGAPPDDEWFCVACNKKFKSQKQWDNHCRSKKHLAAVADLKQYMQDEGDLDLVGLGGDGDPVDDGAMPLPEDFVDDGDAIPLPEDFVDDGGDLPLSSSAEAEDLAHGARPSAAESTKSGASDTDSDKSDGDQDADDILERMVQKKGSAVTVAEDMRKDESSEDAEASESDGSGVSSDVAREIIEDPLLPRVVPPTKGPNRGKKKRRGGNMGGSGDGGKSGSGAASMDSQNNQGKLICVVCGAEFSSRNKLFAHIKATGHAVLRDQPARSEKKKKGKKKR